MQCDCDIYLAAILLDPRDRPRLCHGSQYFPSTKLRIPPSIWRCLHGFGAVRGMQPYCRSPFPDRKLTCFLSRPPHVTLSVSSDPRDGPPWLRVINRDYSVRFRFAKDRCSDRCTQSCWPIVNRAPGYNAGFDHQQCLNMVVSNGIRPPQTTKF